MGGGGRDVAPLNPIVALLKILKVLGRHSLYI